ncbi:MAG TPA: chemotaxis response regulator protein-glutamate methylesterase, partial [Polyangiales bacterium]|nr:chemotaxis response regulator protein-glutamate methylesterase [Polyangiales bacterium]
MTRPLRVFLVDDAAIVRRMLTDALARAPGMAVVGTAPSGKLALSKLPTVHADAVVLDLEMEGMDGLETLAAIREQWPNLPVIMFSAFTAKASAVTIDALLMGANDYVTKPSALRNMFADKVCDELIEKIKTACAKYVDVNEPHGPMSVPLGTTRPVVSPPSGRLEAVVIGLSTGGPNALATLLPKLGADFPLPVLIAQHLSERFTGLLAQRLDALGPLRVKEAMSGDAPTAGNVYIAPGDRHMALEIDSGAPRLRVYQGPHENFCRPSVDILFRSAAEVYGGRVLAVIMTGLGQDGLRGCELVRARGGQVIAQDERTSVVWGMPGSVAKAGLADEVLPLESLGPEIRRRA